MSELPVLFLLHSSPPCPSLFPSAGLLGPCVANRWKLAKNPDLGQVGVCSLQRCCVTAGLCAVVALVPFVLAAHGEGAVTMVASNTDSQLAEWLSHWARAFSFTIRNPSKALLARDVSRGDIYSFTSTYLYMHVLTRERDSRLTVSFDPF